MKRPLHHLLGALLLATATHAAADEGRIIRATELRDAPYSDAKTLQSLPAETAINTVKRKGGWYQIEVGATKGWVRMSTLRLGDGSQGKGSSGVGSALRFLGTGRSEAGGVTTATGIRGLDEADINNAEPDHEALKKFKQQADAERNRKFARDGGLSAKPLPYLDEPEAESPASGSGSWDDGGNF